MSTKQFVLCDTPQGLALAYASAPDTPLALVDFTQPRYAHKPRPGGLGKQPLAKAVGMKKKSDAPFVIDATAGLGRDCFALATLGCQVQPIEQQDLLARCLQDGLDRGAVKVGLEKITTRIQPVICADAIDYLSSISNDALPDVIFLDPMYPNKKKSAQVKKEMRLIQELVGEADNTEALLTCAREHALKRVVVKRPKSAPHLADQIPDFKIMSANTRYDVYLSTQ